MGPHRAARSSIFFVVLGAGKGAHSPLAARRTQFDNEQLYLPFLAISLATFLSFFSFGVSLGLFFFSVRFLS